MTTRTPNKQQLVLVIANGDDRITERLVLNTDGLFELRPLKSFQMSGTDNSIAVLHTESFLAGNGYTGVEAAADHHFIDNTYKSFLAAWVAYLQTGKTRFEADDFTSRTAEDLLAEIKQLGASMAAAK